MGRFFNSKVNAFQDVLNSKIYIDKTGLLEYTNSVIDTTLPGQFYSPHNIKVYLQQPTQKIWKINHGGYAHCVLQQKSGYGRNFRKT